jgi:hypothetical protein
VHLFVLSASWTRAGSAPYDTGHTALTALFNTIDPENFHEVPMAWHAYDLQVSRERFAARLDRIEAALAAAGQLEELPPEPADKKIEPYWGQHHHHVLVVAAASLLVAGGHGANGWRTPRRSVAALLSFRRRERAGRCAMPAARTRAWLP